MGLSIHYSGRLKEAVTLPKLIEDVKDVAIVEKWDYFVFENEFENQQFSDEIIIKNLYGIMITPPNCESLCFTFLTNGKMSGILNYAVLQMDGKINENLTYSVAANTQYSGFENHKKIILLLDFIEKKYLENFTCVDDGNYWETRDEELLKETFIRYTNLINSFSSSIEMLPKNENENIEDYLLRAANVTMKNLKKD